MAEEKGENRGESQARQESAEVQDLESLKKSLAEEKARAESYLVHWQRTQADFLNLKRRNDQEKEESLKFANAMLILNLLPILDDLERAFGCVSAHLAGLTWIDGIRLIQRKLQAVLEAQDLQEIKATGQPFDPHLHEAVMQAEGEEGVVLEELQRGYKLHDRVIRPALVVVGKGKEPEKAPEEGEEQDKGG